MNHQELTEICKAHADWVAGVGGERANLYDANLSNANLYNANLHNANLHNANLSNANLRNANLYDANLYDANLYNANLRNADLHNANLSNANLSNANLRNANLYDADLYDANLHNANLHNANLRNANLSNANLYNANLYNANLRETCLDPENEPNAKCGEFEAQGEHVIGYRTREAGHIDKYRDGRYYSADWFSTADTECHPGLYLWPSLGQAEDWALASEIIRVRTKPSEVHQAGGKWRCRWFEVVGSVDKTSAHVNK